jgi:hypothetical protein
MFHQPCSGEGVIFTLEVEDVGVAYAEAKLNLLKIVLDLRSEDWGQRHFCGRCPCVAALNRPEYW